MEIIAVFGLTISGKGTQSRQYLAFSRCAAQGNSLSGKKSTIKVMVVYTNKPEKPKKLDLSEEEIAKLPRSAMFGNFDPMYAYKEVITRKGVSGKPVEIESERDFKEPNLPLTRMCAFRHAAKRAEAFHLMNQVARKVPINLGESAGFRPGDKFRCEIWAVFGESEDDELLIWDSTEMLASLIGNMNESAVLELLMIPGANPANPDYNPA